jgi:adenylate kinase
MRLVIFGAPGAGKGTRAQRIANKYGVPHISTGDIIRAAIRDRTILGIKARGYVEKGELVPDDLIIELIENRLKESDCKDGFILDGFPRSLYQAKALDKLLNTANKLLTAVINVEVPVEEIITRIKNRLICGNCGKDYNIVANPPPESMICPACGGEIYKRADDTEDTIRHRLSIYEKETALLTSYYKSKKILEKLDGLIPPDQAVEHIDAILKGKHE